MPVDKEQFIMVVSGSLRLNVQDFSIFLVKHTDYFQNLRLISWPQEHDLRVLVFQIFQKIVVLVLLLIFKPLVIYFLSLDRLHDS